MQVFGASAALMWPRSWTPSAQLIKVSPSAAALIQHFIGGDSPDSFGMQALVWRLVSEQSCVQVLRFFLFLRIKQPRHPRPC
jgi:hypothetical protein